MPTRRDVTWEEVVAVATTTLLTCDFNQLATLLLQIQTSNLKCTRTARQKVSLTLHLVTAGK